MTQQLLRVAEVWKLQEIDSDLDVRRASLDDAIARIGETEELIIARDALEEKTQAVRAAQTAQKDVELEADDLKTKIAPVEQKLYGGTVRNPKELQDLQADLDQLKRHLSAVEDRDIEALSALEAAESEMREAQAALDAIDTEWREEQAELSERRDRLSAEMAPQETRRAEVAEAIGPTILARYEHLRRVRGGKAVARLERNLCLGCRIILPPPFVNRAKTNSALVQCPNCERILYS